LLYIDVEDTLHGVQLITTDKMHLSLDLRRLLLTFLCGLYCLCMASQPIDDTQPAGHIQLDFEMKNVTKYLGETIRLKCEISGNPIPHYTWYQENRQVTERDKRFQVRPTEWGSKMRISNLVPSDSGFYTCRGQNHYGTESTTGYLHVYPESNPNPSRDRNPDNDDDDPSLEHNLQIDYDMAAMPPDSGARDNTNQGSHAIGGVYPSGSDDQQGFCQPYRGAACSKFVGNKSIYVRNKLQQGLMEEKLTAAFTVIATSSDLSQRCGEYAIPSLCFYAFPLCDSEAPTPRPRKICRDECELLENDLCKREYIIAKTHPLIGNQFVLPKCELLPETGTPEAANCVGINIPRISKYNSQHQCYNGTGVGYRGTVSKTQSGLNCQRWSSQQQNYYNPAQYPELGNHNYCRNPGNKETGPWCFTSSQVVERCDVPRCAIADPTVSKMLMILVPSIAVPIALALLLTIVCMCRRNKYPSSGHKPINRNNAQQLELATAPRLPTKLYGMRAREFPLSSVRFVQELGEGAFGKVYRGELLLPGEYSVQPVAIKTLKANPSPAIVSDFRREVELMADLRQPNIVCLLGVAVKEEPYCMLFEYTAHGNLHEYLMRHSPHSDVSAIDDDDDSILDHSDMLHLSTQIAAGMEYLASHHFVHRDLAARNILVGDDLNVKISDFGLSRNVYSTDYYCVQSNVQSQSLLPVRWMPPEAILFGKFTAESDVWSFGVLMWEIYSYGLQPYYGYANTEVIEMIRARQVLPSPADCPPRAYSHMLECWNEVPARRSTFRDLHIRLRQWKAELNMPGMHAHNQHPHINYNHLYNHPGTPPHMGVPVQNGSARLLSVGTGSHSGHSGHSSGSAHHSSTDPSDNTNTTGLTHHNPSPHYMPHSPGYPMHPMSPLAPLPPPPISPMPGQPWGHPGVPVLYKKPSPPGSVSGSASLKSSSHQSSSQGSSPAESKPINGYGTPTSQNNLGYGPPVPFKNQYSNVGTPQSPLSPNHMNNYNNIMGSMPHNVSPMFIPDGQRVN